MKSIVGIVFLLGLMLLVLPMAQDGVVLAQEEMTMEEYNQQLQELREREARAKSQIQQLEGEIAALREEIQRVDSEVKQVWNEIYALLGTDEAGVEAFRQQLNALEGDVDALMALSPEELFQRRKEIDDLQARLDEAKQSKISYLPEMEDKIATIEGKINRLRNKLPAALYDEYTVVRGDYLWKISGKPDIYGDPYQWMRIYTYNRDQIKDPDLIYPDQVFKIQRGVGPKEYLVERGEFLAKIAASVGDAVTWRKIYEANRDILGEDPNMLYPYTVLRLPD
jgi:nucleoid-associated protein YgaU